MSLATKAPAAYIAAMMLTSTDYVCNEFRGQSRTDIAYAYAQICARMDAPRCLGYYP